MKPIFVSLRFHPFSAWLGLFLVLIPLHLGVMVTLDSAIIQNPLMWICFPLLIYQDIFICALLSWGTWAIQPLMSTSFLQKVFFGCIWLIGITLTLFAATNLEVFRFFHTPLTLRMIEMSEGLSAVKNSIYAMATPATLLGLIGTPIAFVVLTLIFNRWGGRWVVWGSQQFHSRRGGILTGIYLLVGAMSSSFLPFDARIVSNPHLHFFNSLWIEGSKTATGKIYPADLQDFFPKRNQKSAFSPKKKGIETSPNIIMFVMESVGAQYTSVADTRYETTPELKRMAKNGVNFTRFFAHRGWTFDAMLSILFSLLPPHGQDDFIKKATHLNVPGLSDILAQNGYQTAFVSFPDVLSLYNSDEFLQHHGFNDILSLDSEGDEPPLTSWQDVRPRDHLLLPPTLAWIDAHRASPFFIMLWTTDAHNPYPTDSKKDFGVNNIFFNQYLNVIRSNDQIIEQLNKEIRERGLSESTLLIVLGDHGESFEQHGTKGHFQTVYQEEVWIPLVMTHSGLFPKSMQIDRVGSQIDLAPTILDLIGLTPPRRWQGRSLLAKKRPNRAYLYTRSARDEDIFGLVEGDFKYITNQKKNQQELYDLIRDPLERTNLLGPENASSIHTAFIQRAHRRLMSWAGFHNNYLQRLIPNDPRPKQKR
ncbi:hypothetical protein BVX98_01380 [bacterium F11]|nr:hypothetical protein BVX98_01380 [bacterium F11]